MILIAKTTLYHSNFFPSGDRRGYRISQILIRAIQVIFIPRIEFEQAITNRTELGYNGRYFLFEVERLFAEDMKNAAYIGESENVAIRLRNHHKEMKEWKVALFLQRLVKKIN